MAYEYLNALKDILVYGGISDADMEKGKSCGSCHDGKSAHGLDDCGTCHTEAR